LILDSSVLVAIVLREPGFEAFVEKLAGQLQLGIGTPTLAEAGLVIGSRLRIDAQPVLDRFLRAFEVAQIPFAELHWRAALDAHRRYGRGHHPAALNFGDCLSYAVAKVTASPLLFAGDDFARTDIVAG
jgi:ribonuclease VapC